MFFLIRTLIPLDNTVCSLLRKEFMNQPFHHAAQRICGCIAVLMISVAMFSFIGTGYLSFECVNTYVNGQSYGGAGTLFTKSLYASALGKIRIAALFLFLSGLILYTKRRYVCSIITETLTRDAKHFVRDCSTAFTQLTQCRVSLYTLSGITLLALFNRLIFLFQPMRYDESYTFLRFASRSFPVLLSDYRLPNNHILHSVFMYAAYHLFGNHPWALRLPALIAGVLIIPMTYLLVFFLYNPLTAILCAGCLAASSIMIDYSTNGRGYTMLCLITVMLLIIGLSLRRRRSLTAWILFVSLSALGFYTIPIMLYPFGMALLWIWLSRDASPQRRAVLMKDLGLAILATAFLVVLLYSPVLVLLSQHAGIPEATPLPWHEFITGFPHVMRAVWNQWNQGIPPLISLVCAGGFFLSLIAHKSSSSVRVPISVAAVLWCVPVLFIQRILPFPRVWLFLLPLYIASASSGITLLISRLLPVPTQHFSSHHAIFVLLFSAALSLNVIVTQSPATGDELGYTETMARYLKSSLKSGDRVVAPFPSNAVLQYYFTFYTIPGEYLLTDFDKSQRIFVVINTGFNDIDQILNELQREHHVVFDLTTLIYKHNAGALYQCDVKHYRYPH